MTARQTYDSVLSPGPAVPANSFRTAGEGQPVRENTSQGAGGSRAVRADSQQAAGGSRAVPADSQQAAGGSRAVPADSQQAAGNNSSSPAAAEVLQFPDTIRPESSFSTAAEPFPLFGEADFLPAAHLQTASFYRDTTARAVFGEESLIVAPMQLPAAQAAPLTENPVFQGFVLLLAAAYALLLYRNLADIRTLLGRVSRDTASGKRLTEDPGGSGFPRFLNIATTIGLFFTGIIAVKYGDSLMPPTLPGMFPHGAVMVLSLLSTLAVAGTAAYQLLVVRAAGAVTLSQPFVSQLILLKRTYFSLAVVVSSPALLLLALCPPGTGSVWFCLVAVELLVTALLYLWEALRLFLSKKISILHWFLYLCIVEIFPISLLWLLAAR